MSHLNVQHYGTYVYHHPTLLVISRKYTRNGITFLLLSMGLKKTGNTKDARICFGPSNTNTTMIGAMS